uniref:Uncharacterized protein n=1 Tax=Meloidogyne enterolobii TaxID=390850 RepID=A0A6V7UYI1_MELEN|nr:unnamed protein product [Meloidogyne enterolobii]
MHLDILNRTIPGRHGFDNSGQSYSSAVHWACGTSGCTRSNSIFFPSIFLAALILQLIRLILIFLKNTVSKHEDNNGHKIEEKDLPKIVEIEDKTKVIEQNLRNTENEILEDQLEINENSNEIEEGEIIENEENNNIATAEEDEIKFLNEFKRRIKMEENNACDHSNDTTDLSVTTRKENYLQEITGEDPVELDAKILLELDRLFVTGKQLNTPYSINFEDVYEFAQKYKEMRDKIENFVKIIEYIYNKIYASRFELFIEKKKEINLSTKLKYISVKFKEHKKKFEELNSTIINLKKIKKENQKWLMTSEFGMRLFEDYIATLFCKNNHISHLILNAPCHATIKIPLDDRICKENCFYENIRHGHGY